MSWADLKQNTNHCHQHFSFPSDDLDELLDSIGKRWKRFISLHFFFSNPIHWFPLFFLLVDEIVTLERQITAAVIPINADYNPISSVRLAFVLPRDQQEPFWIK